MKLRTRLNLVVAGLSASFLIVLVGAEVNAMRDAVREDVAGANTVAAHFLGRLAEIYSEVGGPDMVLTFLEHLGRIRANDISLLTSTGQVVYRSPPPTYKTGRSAPEWFARLLAPGAPRVTFQLRGGLRLVVQAAPSLAVLDAWDDVSRLATFAALALLGVNALAFWSIGRMLRPFPVITAGLERIQQGDLAFRLPGLAGYEAHAIELAFNRMAQAVEDKVRVERQAREAEARLEERREMAALADQRVEEERRLIAHELHDEFAQSVTAIRSLALAIVSRLDDGPSPAREIAGLISSEAARLYDAMHGLIPRLAPLSLDTLGLAAALESLVRDWQQRHPQVALSLRQTLPGDLGSSMTLVIYRIAQEGLVNALRHASPRHVDIDARADAERIVVTVDDDGVGLGDGWARPGHFGLRGLQDRVRALGGSFEIGRRPEGGTRLRAVLPAGASR
ncbi:MAG: sensor histidine kinase [Gammaproteobacteria bacterium]|nr:sensor histidine kinase [Gammaproteobacteria bacterium]